MTAALRVEAAPGFTTLQDLGRLAFQHVGVPPSGALDWVSMRLANCLVGNEQDTAVLEILYQGPAFEVMAESVRVALAGTESPIEILGDTPLRIPSWRSLTLRRGQQFRVGPIADTACCYLAVEGGFAVEPCLGSFSTYVRSGLGGFSGRALAPGDLLPLNLTQVETRVELRLPSTPPLAFAPGEAVRVVLGPQVDFFTEAAVETFLTSPYRITQESDRMGMRIDGPRLAHRDSYNIVSDGIATGAIQVPGNGLPIILLADHQTAGGYPKIGTVASADLSRLGRRRPGDEIRFSAVTVEQAEGLRRDLEQQITKSTRRMEPAEGQHLDIESLYSSNLISGVVGPGD